MPDLSIQICALDAERLGRVTHAPVVTLQRRADELPLEADARVPQIEAAFDRRRAAVKARMREHILQTDDGLPRVARDSAQRAALRHLLHTFFEGSATQAIAALLDEDSTRLSQEDWDRLADRIERGRKEGASSPPFHRSIPP